MNEYERVVNSALKIMPIQSARVQHLFSDTLNKFSPEKLKSSTKQPNSSYKKPSVASMSTYYQNLAMQIDDNPGYGVINSRFAYNKHTYSDKKKKHRIRSNGKSEKVLNDPKSYAYYLKDTVKPTYDEILTGRNESQKS